MKKLALILAIFLFVLTSCVSAQKTLGDEILGTWKNSEGFNIEFRSGGIGFIPGVAGQIPDANFNYTIVDESHVQLDLQGQRQTIQITIAGEKLTWKDDLGEVSYTRVK
jgi:hypothetical protein